MEICHTCGRMCECRCVCVCVCVSICVCLAVMTLCLWAPTEYVYLQQQHRAKIDDASLPHARTHMRARTHTHLTDVLLSLSSAVLASLFQQHVQTHTQTHAAFAQFRTPKLTCN